MVTIPATPVVTLAPAQENASVVARLLAGYFPHGLPADDREARGMVRKALEHLLTAPIDDKKGNPNE